jgi:hypothetical protein
MSQANKKRIRDMDDTREKAKKSAADASTAMNDGAVVFGLALAPFTLGASLVAAGGSFLSWYGGNRYAYKNTTSASCRSRCAAAD